MMMMMMMMIMMMSKLNTFAKASPLDVRKSIRLRSPLV